MTEELENLETKLDQVRQARACIAENRGPEKEEAREAYEQAVSELTDYITNAIFDVLGEGDWPGRKVERFAELVLNKLKGKQTRRVRRPKMRTQ